MTESPLLRGLSRILQESSHEATEKTSQEEDRSAKVICQKHAADRFFATVREIQQDNKDADPEEVLHDMTEAVEAIRQEEYAGNTTRRP